jgi:hypothetical protein
MITATDIKRADSLITASLVLEGHALLILRQAEQAREQLAKVRRAALAANRARQPGQAALRFVAKALELTA